MSNLKNKPLHHYNIRHGLCFITMQENLTRFMDEIGAWEEVKRSLDEYLNNIDEKGTDYVSKSIVMPLKYDYWMFTESFKPLLQFLILNPHYYEHVLRNVIVEFVNTQLELESLPFKVQFEQIQFVYRFEDLPLMEEYQFYPTIRKSLSNFTCIVAGRGKAEMYTRQTVWYCEMKCTSNVVANDVQICESCQRTMKECIPLRDVSERVKMIVFPVEMVQTPKRTGTMHQKFDVILRDDLANYNVLYGSAYVITGIYDWVKKAFIAWNIVEKEDD